MGCKRAGGGVGDPEEIEEETREFPICSDRAIMTWTYFLCLERRAGVLKVSSQSGISHLNTEVLGMT